MAAVRAFTDGLLITVGALEASGRRKRPAEANGRTVLFPIDTLEKLRAAAEVRGITANELARRLVDTAAEENMIDAILDDMAQDA